MAKILYWIIRQRDGSYSVETSVHGVPQHAHSGFKDDIEAQQWVDGQRQAGGGMDTWERQPDLPPGR